MKLGLQIPYFNWGGEKDIAPKLREIAQAAEGSGFDYISAMDHFFQIPPVGDVRDPMLESYTLLSFLAVHTKRVRLGTVVTGVIYREPAFLVKQATTLDVLSGGRAFFGIGAAWFEREARGLGFPFPPLGTRFEMLEETLQITKQLWSDETGPYKGRHYTLAETLNSPQPITKPHPPIMVGGGGEKKTLRMVAEYGDMCNLFGADLSSVKHKLEVLRGHCERLGRNYGEIEKTVLLGSDVTGGSPDAVVEHLGKLEKLGIDTAFLVIRDMENIKPIEAIADAAINKSNC